MNEQLELFPDAEPDEEIVIAELPLNEEQARALDAQKSAELNAIEVERAQLLLDVEAAADFQHGYFAFNVPVTDQSSAIFANFVRKFNRAYGSENPITIELCSPGGSIIAGFAVIDTILWARAQGHEVTVRVRGEAASMAAVILQAGTKRECGPNSWIMLHRAGFGAEGKVFEIEDEVNTTKRLEQNIYKLLAERTGKTPKYWEKQILGVRKDVWYSAEEALNAKLIDAIV